MLTPLSNKATVSSEYNKRRSACIVCIEGGLWPEGISRKGQGKEGLLCFKERPQQDLELLCRVAWAPARPSTSTYSQAADQPPESLRQVEAPVYLPDPMGCPDAAPCLGLCV